MSAATVAACAVGISAAAFCVAGIASAIEGARAAAGLYFGLTITNSSLTLMQLGVR